jgi:hypothetical protein
VSQDLGLGGVRIMLPWHRQRTPSRRQQVYLHRIALRVALGDRVVLAIYGRARDAPTTAEARDRYCGFAAHVLARIPRLNDVVIWNEVNNPFFWPRSVGAAGYERLLASCWDTLHGLRRTVNVVDSTAPHQDPAAFLGQLGATYRASHRARPILDTYGHNVYPENAFESPAALHSNASIDEGDYARLMSVLQAAFGGTGQPLPGEGSTTIWYLEDGFQTTIQPDKRRLYSGRETMRALAPYLPPAEASVGAAAGLVRDQASQLREALELAYCQPAVGAFFNFELIDDHDLGGWQSGVLWADGSRKPSYLAFKDAISRVRAGTVTCLPPG